MPWQHFRCAACAVIELVTYKAADTDDPEVWPPRCACGEVMQVAPQPGDFKFDVRTDGDGGRGVGATKGFQKFTVYRQVPGKDGKPVQVPVEIDSLHKLRQVEADSEQRYRNGEGEPLRFRAASQDHSNMQVGLFGTSGKIGDLEYDSGSSPRIRKPDKVEIRRHGERRPNLPTAKHGGESPLHALGRRKKAG